MAKLRLEVRANRAPSRVTEGSPLVTSRQAVFTFLAAFLLLAYAPTVTALTEGLPGVFKYLADDAFYYLAIADHSRDSGLYTFDGTHPTNGFHPLWQYALTGAFRLFTPDSQGQIVLAFATSILFTAVGTGLFALAVLHASHSVALAIVAAVPGLYWWLAPSTQPEFGAQWSFVNGMETPLSILLFGALAWLLIARRSFQGELTARRIAVVSVLLTALALARLDDVFLFAPFFALLALRAESRAAALRRMAVLAAVPLLGLGAYLLFNVAYAGTALPTSGAAKAGGLIEGLGRNLYGVVTTLLPAADLRALPAAVWGDEAWRVTQMVVPALIALGWLVAFGPRLRRPFVDESAYHHAILTVFAGYVVLKAAYNFAFVGIWHQGHWYYPLSIMTTNALVAVVLAGFLHVVGVHRFVPTVGLGGRSFSLRPLGVAAMILLILLAANVFDSVKARRGEVPNHAFWANRAKIGAALAESCAGCGALSFDDGIVAYSLASPTMNGIGLTLDLPALQAKREGRLLDLAYERGFRLIVSINYPIAADLAPGNLRQRLAAYPNLRDEDLSRWRFRIAYRDPASGAVFVRFDPLP